MYHWNLLPHLTGITLDGPDAKAFAHAQFTTSFDDDTAPGWRPTAWCNPKGKVISTMLARSRPAVVDLIVPAAQADLLAQRLPMYAIGRKVGIHTGSSVAGCLADCGEPDCRLVPDEGRGLDLARTDATDDDQRARQWVVRDICAGLVWLSPPVSEQFLPQSLGLEDRGGLSYKKGCYPGQEVVARVHYLGRAKERLSGFRLAGAGSADDVLLDDQGERIGRVLTSLGTGPETIGLAVTRIDAPMDCNVHSNGLQGRLCDPAELC